MSRLFLMFEIRYLPLVMSIVLSAAFAVALAVYPNFIWLWIGFGIAVFFLSVGLRDIWQTPSAILRNYPVIAHLRFLFEFDPAGDAPVLHRGRQRGGCRSRASSARSSTSAPRTSSTSARSAPSSTSTRPATNGSTIRSRRRPHRRATTSASLIGGRTARSRIRRSVFNISAMSFGVALGRTRSAR